MIRARGGAPVLPGRTTSWPVNLFCDGTKICQPRLRADARCVREGGPTTPGNAGIPAAEAPNLLT